MSKGLTALSLRWAEVQRGVEVQRAVMGSASSVFSVAGSKCSDPDLTQLEVRSFTTEELLLRVERRDGDLWEVYRHPSLQLKEG